MDPDHGHHNSSNMEETITTESVDFDATSNSVNDMSGSSWLSSSYRCKRRGSLPAWLHDEGEIQDYAQEILDPSGGITRGNEDQSIDHVQEPGTLLEPHPEFQKAESNMTRWELKTENDLLRKKVSSFESLFSSLQRDGSFSFFFLVS